MADDHYVLATSKPWHEDLAKKRHWIDQRFFWASSPAQLKCLLSENYNIRYVFFLHWNWLVPREVLQSFECVCFHMTDLPFGRGGSPLQNLVARGFKETKLSAIRMTEQMDAGPIYEKRSLSLLGTAEKIYREAGELSFNIIQWMISVHPIPKPQEGEPLIFKRRNPGQSRMPESGQLEKIYDHIRMLDAPTYPKAYLEYGDFVMEFSQADIEDNSLKASVCIRLKNEEESS